MNIKYISIIVFFCVSLIFPLCADENITAQLAHELFLENQYQNAALEYRRLALTADTRPARAGYAWISAYAYGNAGEWQISNKMLNLAEDTDPTLDLPALLLRAESAAARNKTDEADFYLQAIRENQAAPDNFRLYAARRSAALLAGTPRQESARTILAEAPGDNTAGQEALTQYGRGRNKKPWLGGVLGGIFPGLGYAYAGEYANALRSLILNGLFIFGMVNTAENDQWGAFAVITFFETTWYTGSIYGGIDATHRHNRQRLEQCRETIIGGARYTPDWARLPVISLQFDF